MNVGAYDWTFSTDYKRGSRRYPVFKCCAVFPWTPTKPFSSVRCVSSPSKLPNAVENARTRFKSSYSKSLCLSSTMTSIQTQKCTRKQYHSPHEVEKGRESRKSCLGIYFRCSVSDDKLFLNCMNKTLHKILRLHLL